ncbi:MAG: hypothetical protein QXK37_04815 [Candidatus Woesearchaeota archaeon]
MKNIMKRTSFFCIALQIAFLFIATGCSNNNTADNEDITRNSVNSLKQTACNTAQEANTCETKLTELGFVTTEECCQMFKKCCGR